MSKSIITPEFRVSYPKVFKPEPNKLKGGKLEYSIVALFPKNADLTALKKLATEAAVEKFGAEKAKLLHSQGKLRMPFRDQGEKAFIDEATQKEMLPAAHEKGAMFLNLRTEQKPGVVDSNVQEIIDSTQFYGGCYAKASVTVYAYEKGTNAGVNFGLKNVQKTRDGDALGSARSKPQDDFAPIAGVGGSEGSADSLFE